MTAEMAGTVTRERRLANLRATLARGGGAPTGPDRSRPVPRSPGVGARCSRRDSRQRSGRT